MSGSPIAETAQPINAVLLACASYRCLISMPGYMRSKKDERHRHDGGTDDPLFSAARRRFPN
jgi:hypothetical protein